ncbi:MAG: D-alanine--D-alanine ligase family protein, partial [Rhodothermales bacterium]|nr:D-alanine--D-alanine ligase family protein [Rhodothermales bacterium]
MLNIGLVFGGVSPEHEVSVITALQMAAAMDRTKYTPVPLYIAKNGAWYSGDVMLELERYKDLDALIPQATPVSLAPVPGGGVELQTREKLRFWQQAPPAQRLDVLFLALHGGEGENGGVQGICETYNVPYTGSGVFGSALGMDKVITKMVCHDQGVPVVDFIAFRESEWGNREEEWLDECERRLGYPVVVKPARLGSSIGIRLARDRATLDAAIEDALRYDDKVVVEYAVRNLREINCSVMGSPDEATASVLEEPKTSAGEALLTYQEKYMRGASGAKGSKQSAAPSEGMASLDRIIPAPISHEQTAAVQALAVRVFTLFECAGLARIDFLMDGATGQVFFNEINTIPGSFSFYLWAPSGVPFDELAHRLIQLALQRHREKNRRVRSYDVNLLALRAGGAKG